MKTASASVLVFVDMTAQLETPQPEHEPVPTDPGSVPFAPELMIQAGPLQIYVGGSVREATLETVMRVIGHV